jgi:hypothetical protein
VSWLDWLRPRHADPLADQSAARPRGALVASAAVVTPEQGKALAKRGRNRAWQRASFTYRRELPEVGYVMRFLGNNSTHIRLFVGERRRGGDEVLELDDEYGWLDPDTPDPDALPWDLVDAARDALAKLTGDSPSGGGAAVLSPIVQAFEGPGECWLVGRYDQDADTETWGIHSISEVSFHEGKLVGTDTKGFYRLTTGEGRDAQKVDLDPATTTCTRLWTADPEWSGEPDSPMRTLRGTCERLLLIDRANDAALRSRASGNGVMLMPEEVSQVPAPDEHDRPGEDELMRDFTTQLVTPLAQDGSAASVVPMILRGPYAYLDRIRHLTLDRPLDPKLAELETRLLARLGIGMDVPPEVVTGYADVNHWNVWQVDSDTFKHHQEPITIAGVEALTLGYLRHRMRTAVALGAASWTTEQINRLVMWYDPASLVKQPDQRDAANDAFDRNTISAKAHRRLLGLDEGDAPDETQAVAETPVGDTGLLAPQLSTLFDIAGAAIRAGFAPDSVSAQLGLAGFRHTGFRPVTIAEPEVPIIPGGPAQSPQEAAPGTPALEAPPPAPEPAAALTAAAGRRLAPTAKQRRLSRRLMEIDRRLRERLTAAADAALARALERAGNRVRSAAERNPEARVAAAGLPGERVPAALGRVMVAALGADEQALLAEAFDKLRGQWTEWTQNAAEEAITTAAQITGLQRGDPTVMRAVAALRDEFAAAADAAWPALHDGLNELAIDLLYNPDPATPDVGELPDGATPPGLVRAALHTAGGVAADDAGTILHGLTSGQLLTAFLRDNGSVPVEYEWAYGISARPFHPHARLDGLIFAGYTDPALSTAGSGAEWVGGSFAPGDHRGCHCDVALIYADGNTRDELDALGRRAYAEQKPGEPVPGWDATVDPKVRREGNTRPAPRRSPAAARPIGTQE